MTSSAARQPSLDTRTVKMWALAILAAIALILPLLEAVITGRVEELGTYALVQNVGVVALAIIALPCYFIRSRGWKRGSVSILKGVVVVAAIAVLGIFGEWIGKALT